MEIKFEKIDSVYVAEFEITSNCNIHIEREDLGMFTIESRGSKSGKYVPMENGYYGDKYVIDVDMLGNIYPKYIKITSASKPTYAEVNFAEQGGGGNSGDNGMVYIDLRQFPHESVHGQFIYFLSTILFEYGGKKVISTTSMIISTQTEPDAYIAGAFDKNVKISTSSGTLTTIKELIESEGMSLDQLPLITEEEYYNLLNS